VSPRREGPGEKEKPGPKLIFYPWQGSVRLKRGSRGRGANGGKGVEQAAEKEVDNPQPRRCEQQTNPAKKDSSGYTGCDDRKKGRISAVFAGLSKKMVIQPKTSKTYAGCRGPGQSETPAYEREMTNGITRN